jgi:hypothetical protein
MGGRVLTKHFKRRRRKQLEISKERSYRVEGKRKVIYAAGRQHSGWNPGL